jgi:hypothetical protein
VPTVEREHRFVIENCGGLARPQEDHVVVCILVGDSLTAAVEENEIGHGGIVRPHQARVLSTARFAFAYIRFSDAPAGRLL